MKVLVTGINGFVGQHLLRELKSRNIEVHGIDTESRSAGVMAVNILNQNLLDDVLKEISPDYIIHLAAIANVDHSNVSLIYNINCNGTLNLLIACSKLNTKPGFLFVSSSQVYGNVPEEKLPIYETCPVNPVNHYGASKAAGEMAVKAFGAEYGIEYVIVRPFNHTGTGQSDRFVIPKIVNAFRRGDKSIELGNINTVRDYTDVRDVVKGYCDIIGSFQSGETYNISSGNGKTVHEIFDILTKITGREMKIIQNDTFFRKSEIKSVIGNAEKLKSATGWKNENEIEDTLISMLNCQT